MPQVKLATLNLFNRSGQWGMRAPLVVDQLEDLAPDVIGLQEVDLTLDQGMWLSRQINKRLPGQPHYRIKHATNPGTRASYHSIATMSRIGFEEHEVLDLMSFERVAQRFVFRCGDRPFVFVNTHLHHPPEAQQERVTQLEYLLAWLDRDARRLPVVISGDFNAYADPPEPAVKLMKSRFRSAHEAVHGREPEKTWTTPMNTHDGSPHGTLDYIFVSPEFRIAGAGLAFDKPSPIDPNVYPSDHLGLFAVLEL
ncbi:MAG: endonuclease/exonuclease/phosphatase family protein [Chloroflexota bacterium]|nr:endonuclease/exonuclease/phosphatase family protein [Chloroflexota bacterium]